MAPPTGKTKIFLHAWSHDHVYYACESTHRWARRSSGQDRHEVLRVVREVVERNLRGAAEVREPYYVDALMEAVEWNVVCEECFKCRSMKSREASRTRWLLKFKAGGT